MALAARDRLPAVYAFRFFVAEGGLMSYGPSSSSTIGSSAPMSTDPARRQACRPSDRDAEQDETITHLKTAKMLGLTVPASPPRRAAEVIE